MSEAPARDESELIELLRSIDMRAPDALHRRVRALIADASVATPRRPMFGWLSRRGPILDRPEAWRVGGAHRGGDSGVRGEPGRRASFGSDRAGGSSAHAAPGDSSR